MIVFSYGESWKNDYSLIGAKETIQSQLLCIMPGTNYATYIVRNDNPRLVEVITEFTTTVSMLNQKP